MRFSCARWKSLIQLYVWFWGIYVERSFFAYVVIYDHWDGSFYAGMMYETQLVVSTQTIFGNKTRIPLTVRGSPIGSDLRVFPWQKNNANQMH